MGSTTTIVIVLVSILMIFGAYKLFVKESYQMAYAPYNTTVKGVPIMHSKYVYGQSCIQSGMCSPEQYEYFTSRPCTGQKAYDQEMEVLENTLEMQQDQENMRAQVAAAMTNYIPLSGGTTNTGKWYERTYVDLLNQPNFSPKLKVSSCTTSQ
jgi:hypothetical protein